jgi:sigma-B regulation protein RsbU (phosphoserine phosphatase)
MANLESMQAELLRLRSEKTAIELQSKLLESFVTLARSDEKHAKLPLFLRKTLELSAELTGAEKGSLFLLDSKGVVTDSILTRRDTSPQLRAKLIGRVLDKGLAGWVVRNRKIGLINDTRRDRRWLDLPDQPYRVRSALAVPVLSGNELLGISTLLHSAVGHFDAATAKLMQLTAGQIGIALENARLFSRLETYSRALDAELEKGKTIQRNFLPRSIPRIPGWDIAACFHPALQVSGDFYDVFALSDNALGIVIADVCDKGVGSALFMALFRSLIRVFSGRVKGGELAVPLTSGRQTAAPERGVDRILKAVELTNNYIAEEHGREGMFATVFFGVLEPETGRLSYINAGHEPPYLVGESGIKTHLPKVGPALGAMPDQVFTVKSVLIEPGDTLFGYTDGVTEALSPSGTWFTKKRLETHLSRPESPAGVLIEAIRVDLFGHMGSAPQFDDITMIAVHREHV